MRDSEAITSSSMCVLLVDDDLDVLAANARFLRLSGYTVIVADAAGSAVDRLKAETVDVVVTDLRMPGCDGLAFAREARTVNPLIPIVFFSGYANIADVVAAMKLGAVDFLEKPVEPEQLLQTLASIQRLREGSVGLQRSVFDIADESFSFRQRVLAYEKYLIESSLLQHEGRIGCVLRALNINRRTLNHKMARLGIVREER